MILTIDTNKKTITTENETYDLKFHREVGITEKDFDGYYEYGTGYCHKCDAFVICRKCFCNLCDIFEDPDDNRGVIFLRSIIKSNEPHEEDLSLGGCPSEN